MRIAIIGSRSLQVDDLEKFIPAEATEIVFGGAKGIDSCARTYAVTYKLALKEFIPDYKRYGKSAPLKRNLEIINHADQVIAFWDGKSKGTKYVIDKCKTLNIKCTVHLIL